MVSGNAAGRAYTFSASTGKVLKSFTSPNSQFGGQFGESVAISGTTVLVGAYREIVSGLSNAGNAYAFSTTSGSLLDIFTSPNPETNSYFGVSVALSSTTMVVGAEGETGSGVTEAGDAYIV